MWIQWKKNERKAALLNDSLAHWLAACHPAHAGFTQISKWQRDTLTQVKHMLVQGCDIIMVFSNIAYLKK